MKTISKGRTKVKVRNSTYNILVMILLLEMTFNSHNVIIFFPAPPIGFFWGFFTFFHPPPQSIKGQILRDRDTVDVQSSPEKVLGQCAPAKITLRIIFILLLK